MELEMLPKNLEISKPYKGVKVGFRLVCRQHRLPRLLSRSSFLSASLAATPRLLTKFTRPLNLDKKVPLSPACGCETTSAGKPSRKDLISRDAAMDAENFLNYVKEGSLWGIYLQQ